jgi:site-specific recombinase XerD
VEGRATKTLLWYHNALQDLARFTNGHDPAPTLESLAAMEVRGWMSHLLDKGLAKVSVNCYFRAVRSFYNWCQDEGLSERTPLTNITPPGRGGSTSLLADRQVRACWACILQTSAEAPGTGPSSPFWLLGCGGRRWPGWRCRPWTSFGR